MVASAALLLLLPLLLLIAVLVRWRIGHPVLFSQQRAGKDGHYFRFIKFRTMVRDAHDQKMELLHRNEMSGPVFKIRDDPRVVSRLGRLLRRYSLDELPQLWNVLQGHMSLVGPRPLMREEVDEFTRRQRGRLAVKPGLTCYWQINGRNDVDFDQWMEQDLDYVQSYCRSSPLGLLWLDVSILLRTLPAVLSGKGAC